tara:strand:- start:32213 stop:33643 length:1431 start_codon:yes stop_codon:yes gene_type:complete
MSFKEYDNFDALGLAELVKKKEVSAEELLEEAIQRTEKVDGQINAVVLKHYDEAKAMIERGLPEGTFTGVPYLLKDLHVLLTGTKTTYGSKFFKDYVADHNSTLVDRYLEAGLVIFGKTNSPEFGLTVTTEPELYGPTRNPWNLDHSAGGSSGGAASAVASGILPMANASDGGGSIRIPASCCGLVGLKPTRARTPMGPDRGEGWAGQSISHCVSKTVRDSAALLDATTGFSPGDPYAPTEPSDSFLAATNRDPGKLKIALHLPTDSIQIDDDVVTSIKNTAKLCEDLGHHIEEASPEADNEALSEAIGIIISANVSLALEQRAEALGTEVTPDVVENITYRMYENGKTFSADQYAKATLINHQAGRVLGNFMENYDLILSPVLNKPPVKIGEIDMSSPDIATYIERLSSYSGFTAIYNQTGQPSISVPLGFSKNELPIGSMFTAKFGNDELLISVASQLETASPWAAKKPPIYSS